MYRPIISVTIAHIIPQDDRRFRVNSRAGWRFCFSSQDPEGLRDSYRISCNVHRGSFPWGEELKALRRRAGYLTPSNAGVKIPGSMPTFSYMSFGITSILVQEVCHVPYLTKCMRSFGGAT